MSTWELILIPLKTTFQDLDTKGGISLPKLLVDFNGSHFYPPDVFSERFSLILNRSGALCTHYCHTVGYETTQLNRYQSTGAIRQPV